jgi:hypothetical protein
MKTIKTYTNKNGGRPFAADTDRCGSSAAPIVPKGGSPMIKQPICRLVFVFAALLLAAVCLPANAGIIYVNSSASGAGNGSTWLDAFTDLQDALKAAFSGDSIFVAADTFKPTADTDRNISFQLKTGVKLYGGFSDSDTLLSQRDWKNNVTILSADIGTPELNTDNSYHVVKGSETDSTAVLDGFTVTMGYADGSGNDLYGGGMFNESGSPTVTNVVFSDNFAYNGGGGMRNQVGSSPRVVNAVFLRNATYYSGSGGGGMANNVSDPRLTNVTFTENDAGSGYGGGIANYQSTPTLVNVILWGNSAPAGNENEIHNNQSETHVSYSLIEGGLPAGCTGSNNIFEDPLFENVAAGNLRLIPTSPAVNAGNSAAPDLSTTDLDGNPRIAGVAVDMGAYEYPCPTGSVVYVDKSASGANNGTSWADAFKELREALEWAPCANVTEIWVAAGTYKPTAGTNRIAPFQLVDGVAIYGGFAGGETSVSQRDWVTNVTTLSGDIGTVNNPADNSVHVVTGSGTNETAVLDGFTITGGNADGIGGSAGWGGGMYVEAGSPTLVNLAFSSNKAFIGGGMYNLDSSPKLINVVFTGNTADDGGGMENYRSSPVLVNAVFSGNSAGNEGGAILNVYPESQPTLINVTVVGNSSGVYGGAMLNAYDTTPTIVNTILWGNAAPNGNEIYNKGGTYGGPGVPEISYSLVAESGGSAAWDTTMGTDGGNNIDVEPLFVVVPGGGLRLLPISPAVDAGDNTALPTDVTTDLDGNSRIVNGIVDMGAYESQASCPPGNVLYVNPAATGANDGTSWTDAFTEVLHALEWSQFCPNVTEIWVAAGTYKPTAGLDDDRNATFQLVNGIAIYGGFAGTESFLSQRDWVANETILSGDIGVEGDNSDNCYHVVTGSGTDARAILNGFTITGGNANASVSVSTSPQSESRNNADLKPTISGTPIAGSRSDAAMIDTHGGGMYINGGSPALVNVVFSGNYAADGGGMYNDSGSPLLVNVTFADNSALWGGGMHNYDLSSPTLVNVIFWKNTADFGAGIYNNWSDPELVNVTVSLGDAYSGGGIYNNSSDPVLINTILWGDSAEAESGGPEIHNASSTPDISYSLIAGCGGSGGWDSDLGNDGGNNVDADPLFVDGAGGNLYLYPGSPAIDAGNNAAPNLAATDFDGNTRIANETVDLGAYESQATPCPPGTVLYVDADATGANDGSSWDDAFTDLQTALYHARCPGITEVWVAAGTYKPTRGTDREANFRLVNGVAVYGGFAGTETSLAQRHWAANETVLSGDIGTSNDVNDNSYHVVTGSGTDSTAVLDGFTVTKGYANGSGNDLYGGGMFNESGGPTVINVFFSKNFAYNAGGGMRNQASSSPRLMNVVFYRNSTYYSGGGGGGLSNNVGDPTLTNVTFTDNDAGNGYGGGIANYQSNPTLINTILWGNSAPVGHENEIYGNQSATYVVYSLIEGGLPTGCTDGGNNVYVDPLFVDASGGDLRLIPGSPAIDAGNNAAVPSDVITDLDGNPRIVDGAVDMGAYESQGLPPCPPDTVLYVDANATGANNGTSWSDAFTELRNALTWMPFCPSVTEIWVAAGTYHPTSGSDRGATFQLADGVAIYGGFAGSETSLSERDWATNVTILSGNIGDPGIDTDNSYHVVTGSGTDPTAVLDGFTITGGYASGSGDDDTGGGMINISGSPTLTNLILVDNYAYAYGGGMYNYTGSSPTLTNVVFTDNSVQSSGGGGAGMENSVDSDPTLTNVTFSNNVATNGYGGAMFNYNSAPVLVNTILWGNSDGRGYDQIYNNSSTPMVVSYSLVADSLPPGCTDGGHNVYDDPLFVDGPGGDLRLSTGSPAIDAGDNTALPIGVTTDLAGAERIVNGTADMGAYEFQASAVASVFPSPLVFAQIAPYQSTCDTLRIANVGGATCTITAIHGCETAPFSMDTTMTAHTLAPGDTAKILVCVNPTVAGPDTAEVTIVSDATNSPTTVQVRIDAVTAVGPDRTPKPFQIVSVSPNPFNPTTAVHFTLPEAMPVTAVIWSVAGERVRVLAKDERFEPGDNRLIWNGRTDRGTQAASGVYFIRIETCLGAKVARAVLLK